MQNGSTRHPLGTLRVFLTRVGWSQADLAEATGFSLSLVEGVIGGWRRPSPRFRREVSLALAAEVGSDADDLGLIIFGADADPKPEPTSVLQRRIAKEVGAVAS